MPHIISKNATSTIDPVELLKIIRRPRLCDLIGISRAATYLREDPKSKYFDPKFPKSLKIGANSVGWRLGDVLSYIESLQATKAA